MEGTRSRLNAARWAITGAALLLLTDILLARVLWNERQYELKRGQEVVQLASSVILRRADALFDVIDRNLSGVGEAVGARGLAPVAEDLYLHRLLVRRHAITPALGWMLITDSVGSLVSSSLRFPVTPIALADREYVRTQLQAWDDGLHIGLPIISRTVSAAGTPVIPVSRRLSNDGGRLIGVAAAGLKAEFLHELVIDPTPPEGMRIGLFRSDGHALACLPSRDTCPDAPDEVMAQLTPLEVGASRALEPQLPGGGRGVGAYRLSADYPIFVVAYYPHDRLLAGWHANLPFFIAIAVGGNAALVVIGLYAFRQVARRRRAIDELATANRELEDRVRDRTAELARLANTDVLTGAPNRRWFMAEGQRLLALARRHRRPMSLMVLDADRFKSINDQYGHAAGDAVLCTLAAIPAAVLRESDVFARLGGEEFGVLLPETGDHGAREVGERLLAAFRNSTTAHEGMNLRFTVSIGLAQLEAGDSDLEALLKRADTALYRAKLNGRDRLEGEQTTSEHAP